MHTSPTQGTKNSERSRHEHLGLPCIRSDLIYTQQPASPPHLEGLNTPTNLDLTSKEEGGGGDDMHTAPRHQPFEEPDCQITNLRKETNCESETPHGLREDQPPIRPYKPENEVERVGNIPEQPVRPILPVNLVPEIAHASWGDQEYCTALHALVPPCLHPSYRRYLVLLCKCSNH